MAQTGYTPISLYYSSTASAAPSAGNLVAGELAINTADGKLFYKDSGGTVQTIATKGGVNSTSNGQVLFNNSGAIGGTNKFLWDSTNNALSVVATTTGQSSYIRIGNSADSINNYLYSSASSFGMVQENATSSSLLYFSTQNTERMRINYQGYVMIGSITPKGYLTISTTSTGQSVTMIGRSADGYSQLTSMDRSGVTFTGYIGFEESGATAFGAANTGSTVEFGRFDSSGNLLVGKISASAKLNVSSDSGNVCYFQNSSGTGVYLVSGGNSWTAASDERIKDIIEPISNAVSKVSSLRSVIGKYKTDPEDMRRSFLIAQDVQKVLPEAVNQTPEGDLGVSYTDVIPLLVAAIKELKAEIDILKSK